MTGGRHVVIRSDIALRRRRMHRKIRETVAQRRFAATLSAAATPPAQLADTASTEPEAVQG